MIEDQLYKKLHGERIIIAGKIFELEFDAERRCFRLYQKKKTLGTKSVDIAIQAALEADLDYINYLERVNQPLPRHSYLLLDATTLKTLIDQRKAEFEKAQTATVERVEVVQKKREYEKVKTEALQSLVAEEEKEKKVLESVKLDKKRAGRRVWLDHKDCYKTCIDNSQGLFIKTTKEDAEKSLEAFKSYIVGETYLRRKSKIPVPMPFWWGRTFDPLQLTDLQKQELLIAGVDDSAAVMVSSKNPQNAPDLVQSLVLFPIFLLAVKGGIAGLKEESQETIEGLNHIEREIEECEETIKKFLEAEEFNKAGAMECFAAITKLKHFLDELPKAKIEATSSSMLGYPGMILIFTSMVSYQLQAILNLAKDVDKLNTGLGNLSTSGYDYSKDMGGFGVAGNGLLIGGEAIMIVFIIAKVAHQMRDYAAQRKEISAVKKSDKLSQLAKDIIVSIKDDEQFYNLVKIIGNSTLVIGQILGLTPLPYAGLAVSLAGLGVAVGAETIKEARHDFDKNASEIEEEISSHYIEKLVTLVLEQVKENATEISENFQSAYSKILRQKAFAHELFFHLASAGLAVQKILREGEETGSDFEKAAKKAEEHYEKHSHQAHLHRLVLDIEKDATLPLKDAMSKAKRLGDYAYMLLHERMIAKLRITKNDGAWIKELAEKLSEYEATQNPDLITGIKRIPNLPANIALAINTSYKKWFSFILDVDDLERIEFTRKALYEEVIPAIQRGFLESRLDKTEIDNILDDIAEKTEEERAQELKLLLLESEAKSVFTIEAAQEKYNEENSFFGSKKAKKKGEYDQDKADEAADEAEEQEHMEDNPEFIFSSTKQTKETKLPITIVGNVVKSGGGLFKRDHTKRVYALNPRALEKVSRKAVEAAFSIQKYYNRSATLRAVHEMTGITENEETTVDLFTKMTKRKEPGHDPHSNPRTHVINLTGHDAGHTETEI